MATNAAGVAVITGASAGLGRATAEQLAAAGWRIIALGRNPVRCEQAEKAIAAASTGAGVSMIVADLALLAEARRAATEIASLTDRIDLLVNNAGGMASEQVMTPEGLEENFAGNHLGPFLLTNLLLPLLRRTAATSASGRVRVINTSSDASEMIEGMNWDDLQSLENYTPGAAYCSSKLANVLFARALAQRLGDEGVIAHAVHPGTIDSNFMSHVGESTRAYMATLDKISPEEGARALVWLATSEEAAQVNGRYFHGREEHAPNPQVEDAAAVERLWDESARLVGL